MKFLLAVEVHYFYMNIASTCAVIGAGGTEVISRANMANWSLAKADSISLLSPTNPRANLEEEDYKIMIKVTMQANIKRENVNFMKCKIGS